MLPFFDYFRQLNIAGVALRLLLATLFGGYIGYERGRKHRAAGLRTYMIVCIGAALTLLIGQYQFTMYRGAWQALISHIDSDPDVARYGAQVVNGIGFLGAGTIILTGRREVKGLTTAAGLWASACMGLAIGAGFYEGVFVCVILIALSMRALSWLETKIVERTRNVNLFVEFGSMKQKSSPVSRRCKSASCILTLIRTAIKRRPRRTRSSISASCSRCRMNSCFPPLPHSTACRRSTNYRRGEPDVRIL